MKVFPCGSHLGPKWVNPCPLAHIQPVWVPLGLPVRVLICKDYYISVIVSPALGQ